MYVAAGLLAADVGTRIVYVPTGDYDTHADHAHAQTDNLAQVDAAVDGFLSRVEDYGLADRVLVASISEFGRRVPENDNGLDHGSASTMLLAGPVGNERAASVRTSTISTMMTTSGPRSDSTDIWARWPRTGSASRRLRSSTPSLSR